VGQSNYPVTQKVIYFDLGTNIEHACLNSDHEPSNEEYRQIFENSYDLFREKQKSKFLNIVQHNVEFYDTAERDSDKIAFKILQGDA
jgi:hypothetical protein